LNPVTGVSLVYRPKKILFPAISSSSTARAVGIESLPQTGELILDEGVHRVEHEAAHGRSASLALAVRNERVRSRILLQRTASGRDRAEHLVRLPVAVVPPRALEVRVRRLGPGLRLADDLGEDRQQKRLGLARPSPRRDDAGLTRFRPALQHRSLVSIQTNVIAVEQTRRGEANECLPRFGGEPREQTDVERGQLPEAPVHRPVPRERLEQRSRAERTWRFEERAAFAAHRDIADAKRGLEIRDVQLADS
jgi:hypothetical protein